MPIPWHAFDQSVPGGNSLYWKSRSGADPNIVVEKQSFLSSIRGQILEHEFQPVYHS